MAWSMWGLVRETVIKSRFARTYRLNQVTAAQPPIIWNLV